MSAAGQSLETDTGAAPPANANDAAGKAATDAKLTNIVDGGKGTATGDDAAAAAAAAAAGKELPTNWRDLLAGDDKEALTALGRITDPKTLGKSFVEMRKQLSKAQKAELAKDATPEQVAEYRKANGIPEKPDGYLEGLPKDITFTDQQKPMVGKFAENMLAINTPPQYVQAALATYHQIQAETQEGIRVANENASAAGREALIEEWGSPAEFKSNMGAIENLLAGAPKDVVDALKQSRGPDGLNILNNPNFIKFLAQTARDLNPAATVVPGYGVEQTKALASEIETIEKTMRETPDKYWGDEKMQGRYRELLGARDRIAAKV